jgi:hypothetical protein
MLYYWSSAYLRNYSNGYIIVEAGSVEEARRKARAYFEQHFRDRYCYLTANEELDEDGLKRRSEFLELLQTDLEAEPRLVERGVIFIPGSE